MTEDEAKSWIDAQFGAAIVDRLEVFAELVRGESTRQNLVSASSLAEIWSRHIVDSAQLVPVATQIENGPWIDIGTGAGFPGVVVGLITGRQTILVEPRKRRVEFLQSAIDFLGLGQSMSIAASKAEGVSAKASTISARAVASVDSLLRSAHHLSTKKTQWLLPKGKNAAEEIAFAKSSWHGTFHVEQSLTDPTSLIVIASGITRR